MNSLHIKTKMPADGKLTLDRLPFEPGEELEIEIQPAKSGNPPTPTYPLRGSVIRYDDPFEPAAPPEDWEALR
jgi:hypothetical protein